LFIELSPRIKQSARESAAIPSILAAALVKAFEGTSFSLVNPT
jgi:hypothetical protein